MKKGKTVFNTEKTKKNLLNKTVTAPISQEKLLSKVNELTLSSSISPVLSVQGSAFKGETTYLNYKNYKDIIDKLTEISNTTDLSDFYKKIYSIILENVDSNFFAIGLYKEQSNCI